MPLDWQAPRRELGEVSLETYLERAYEYDTDAEIAGYLTRRTGEEVSVSSVTKKRQTMGLSKTLSGDPLFDASKYVRYTDSPRWVRDDSLHICDAHAPYHDAKWMESVVRLAIQWDVGLVHCAGDLFDFDALSYWAKGLAREERTLLEDRTDVELSDEIDAVIGITDALLDHFDTVELTLGNHEARLSRRMNDAAIRVRLLRQLLGYTKEERFNVYPYCYGEVVTERMGKVRVSHPKNSSVIAARVPSRMADKYRCHYASAHGHDWGEVTSVSGYWAASMGCCADPDRLAYVATVDNLRPFMQRGALIFKDGLPVLLHPKYNPPERFLTTSFLVTKEVDDGGGCAGCDSDCCGGGGDLGVPREPDARGYPWPEGAVD